MNWNAWYLAGQCYRFLNNSESAIEHLSRAAAITSDHPQVLLALGIAFQLSERWEDAIQAFRLAIEMDADYAEAYNSLAFTQKKCGDFDSALHNYDAGAKALTRRMVKGMKNGRASLIIKHRDTVGTLWIDYVFRAGLYLACTVDGISKLAFPTGEMAIDEERTERHAGLYWIDTKQKTNSTMRLLLPNYFNYCREQLKTGKEYSLLIGNRGRVLELLGRREEADQHFAEANEFLSL
jgi:tetratricopeptide (TPR) repeat protein